MMAQDTPVAVAMSGGVDSSVAACLLAGRGRAVIGFSMHFVDRLRGAAESYGRCCSPDDFRDAAAVADAAGFPHYVLDLAREFRRDVIEPFARDYAAGRTPSPCVRCNTELKFGVLLARARALGAPRVATGHYAILQADRRSGRTLLWRAVDAEKDQSYFLFDLSEDQRRAAELPLGHMTKDQVRAVARERGLGVADKRESMDLCFVGAGESYREFLEREGLAGDDAPGEIVDGAGRRLGAHDGVSRFTVGQRRGLGLAAGDRRYVLRVDARRRHVVVGGAGELLSDRLVIERSRWIPFDRPGGELRARVRIRSGHAGSAARLRDLGHGRVEVRFDEPQRAVAPGQAAVAYDGDLVLGGGWIAA
jgi:tRNA-specific 2-thiouridylase